MEKKYFANPNPYINYCKTHSDFNATNYEIEAATTKQIQSRSSTLSDQQIYAFATNKKRYVYL